MKNRKTVVVAFLLTAVMLLGVGYAALTDVLDINGTADVSKEKAEAEFNNDVYFTAAVPLDEENGDVASIVATDPDMANFTVASLSSVGDTAKFKFTIINEGNVGLDAIVTPTLAADGNSNPEFFKITSDWQGQAKELKAGESIEYIITVELIKTPEETIHGSFHIELTATSVGDDATETESESAPAEGN